MKLLADENVPLATVRALQGKGLDVVMVRDVGPGATDSDVLHMARDQGRVLITLDRDFGELVFLRNHPSPPAIIFIRTVFGNPVTGLAEPLEHLIRTEAVEGFFWVMNRENWRRHRLPR